MGVELEEGGDILGTIQGGGSPDLPQMPMIPQALLPQGQNPHPGFSSHKNNVVNFAGLLPHPSLITSFQGQ